MSSTTLIHGVQTTVYFNPVKGTATDTIMRFNSFTGSKPDAMVNGTFKTVSELPSLLV